jgi:hypothetical protein
VKKSLGERQRHPENFNINDDFKFAESIALSKFDEPRLTTFLESALVGGAEGVTVELTGDIPDKGNANLTVARKRRGVTTWFSASTSLGVRSHTWLKVKRDYVAGFADTIDVGSNRCLVW